ncbi:hypothetical protein FPQ18DRAFT_305606 [Pyronema domesticum]|nr:hypothetical protein FPQ18DRAFT_305606 [Pyronema domesticum]
MKSVLNVVCCCIDSPGSSPGEKACDEFYPCLSTDCSSDPPHRIANTVCPIHPTKVTSAIPKAVLASKNRPIDPAKSIIEAHEADLAKAEARAKEPASMTVVDEFIAESIKSTTSSVSAESLASLTGVEGRGEEAPHSRYGGESSTTAADWAAIGYWKRRSDVSAKERFGIPDAGSSSNVPVLAQAVQVRQFRTGLVVNELPGVMEEEEEEDGSTEQKVDKKEKGKAFVR